MPLTYQLDPTRRLVTCTGQGAVTGEEVAALVTALLVWARDVTQP